jgi:uncharacterized protein YuzE
MDDTPAINYDEPSDTLYISFAPGENATGIELSEHILLRLNKADRRAVGLTFFEYSLLAQPTEIGPRSFPLNGLDKLSNELRALVLEVITRPPVNNFLHVSLYTPSVIESIPITSVMPLAPAPA